MKQPKIEVSFEVEAGKYDGDEENCKYCNSFDSADEAVHQFAFVSDYPWARLDVYISVDGATSRINLLGGDDPLLRLKTDVANLWMKATGTVFAPVNMSSEEQITDINLALQGMTNRLWNQGQEIKSLQRQVLNSARPTWQVIKRGFDSGALGWTEAFEALMSECGYPMEEALQLLVENFDRRPPAEM